MQNLSNNEEDSENSLEQLCQKISSKEFNGLTENDLLEKVGKVIDFKSKSTLSMDMLELIKIYASSGLTDESLAMMIGLSVDEFRDLRVKDSAVERAIISGRLPLIKAINGKIFEQAMGLTDNVKVKTTVEAGVTSTEIVRTKAVINEKLLIMLAKNFAGWQEEGYISHSDKCKLSQKEQEAILKVI